MSEEVEPGVSKGCHCAAIITAVVLCLCGTPLFIAGTVVLATGGRETEYMRYLFMVGLILLLIGVVLLLGGIILIVLLLCTDYLSTERRKPPEEDPENTERERKRKESVKRIHTTIIQAYKFEQHHKKQKPKESASSSDKSQEETTAPSPAPAQQSPARKQKKSKKTRPYPSPLNKSHYYDRYTPSEYTLPSMRSTPAPPKNTKRKYNRKLLTRSSYEPSFSNGNVKSRGPVTSHTVPSSADNRKKTHRGVPEPPETPYFWDSAPFHTH